MTALTIPITLIMQIPTLWCIRRVAPELAIGWRGAAFKYVRMVLGFSSGVFLIQAAGQLQTKTDEIVIGSYLPITFVTPYNIARRLSEIPQILTDQFIKVLLPLASDMHAADEQERITNLYLASSRLTLAMFLPLACTLAILAAQIITFWVGATYASYAPLVLVLVLASLVDTSTWPAGHVLQGMARHHPVAVISICSGVVNLVLSILLVPQLGVMGVALGTLIPTCIECVGFVIPYTLRVLQINPRTWILTVVWPVVVPTIATSIVVYLFQTIWYPLSLFGIIGTASLGVFVFIGLYIQLNRAAPEVELLRHKFEQTWQDRFVCFQR
jgi:O-antigen/teichoic acid export membrane protein